MTKLSDDTKLRMLANQVTSLTAKIRMIKESSEKEIKKINEEKSVLEKQIFKLKNPETLKVSEHGLLRYVERIENINIEEIKKKILSPSIINMVNTLGGNGTYPHEDGYKVIVKNNIITTVIK